MSSEDAAAKKEMAEEKKVKKVAGASYMKLDSFCSLNETFETPNIRKLK